MMSRLAKPLLFLVGMGGAVLVGVAYGAEALDIGRGVQIDTTVNIVALISTMLTLVGMALGGVAVWTKLNRWMAAQSAQMDAVMSRIDKAEQSIVAVHQRVDAFFLSGQGRGVGQ